MKRQHLRIDSRLGQQRVCLKTAIVGFAAGLEQLENAKRRAEETSVLAGYNLGPMLDRDIEHTKKAIEAMKKRCKKHGVVI
jgi:hypothetical protein